MKGQRRFALGEAVGSAAAISVVARAELRRRWVSLISLVVMTALVSGAVFMALTGAMRTSSTVQRFRERSAAGDAYFQSSVPEQTKAILRAVQGQPQVEQVTSRLLVNGWPDDPAVPDIGIQSDPTGAWGTQIDRPRLLAGRFPSRDSDEVLLSSLASRLTGAAVGDTIAVHTWSADDLEQLFAGKAFPGFNGPHLDLRVVGVGRFPDDLSSRLSRGDLTALAGSGFVAHHPGIGAWPGVVVARLEHGAADVTPVIKGATEAMSVDQLAPSGGVLDPTTAEEAYLDSAQDAVRSLSIGLVLLGLGAAAAGSVALGQAISRQTAVPTASARALAAMGSTPTGIALGTALPVVAAGVVGVVVGAVAATIASPLLPTGLARRAEVSPGVWVSPVILALGGVVMVVAVGAWAFRSARRSLARSAGAESSSRSPSLLGRAAAGMAMPVSALLGVHLANDRGGDLGTVRLRSAVVGVAVGVSGLLAAGVIVASLHDLSTHPARWGWTWSTNPDYFGDGDVAELEDRVVGDERVDAVGDLTTSGILLDGQPITGDVLESRKGDLSFTALDGRLPDRPDEVALGEQTMADLGVSIGDTVKAATPDGSTTPMRVVGTALIPGLDVGSVGVGAVVTAEGLSAHTVDDPLQSMVIRYAPGLSPSEVEAGLHADYGLAFTLFSRPQVPGPISNLAASRYVAVSLAAFFLALAALALLHALVEGTRRRRGELALVQALGVRPRQIRVGVLTQSLLLSAQGVLVGVPIGVVAGRVVWRLLAEPLRAVADPVVPWPLLAGLVPVAAAVAVVLAWWPSRMAVRGRPAVVLHRE